MRRHLSTIVMVVIAAALGLYLWRDRDHATTGEKKARANSVFRVWRKEELKTLTIVHEGETITLEKDGDAWFLRAPRKERADGAAVDRLLGSLEYATIARRASEGSALGLDVPRATGTIVMGGLTLRFALGGPSPRPEGSSYLRVDEEAPIVVTKELALALLDPADTYRDRTVVPYLATELTRFEVEGRFVIDRLDERSWKVAASGVLASRAAVDSLWAALAQMRAETFPKDADADRLTASPVAAIVLTPKSGAPSRIVIGEACPGHPDDVVVLRKTPSRAAACAPKDIVPRLAPAEDVLLERRPFTLRMDEIEELRLEQGARILELARKGTGFHERLPEDRELTAPEADAANDVLTRLGRSEALSVTRGGPAFAAVARARVTSGDPDETVEVGAADGQGHVVLRRTLDDARLVAPPALARLLVPRLTTLRPHAIVEKEERRPSRIAMQGCGVDQELVDRGAGFRLVTPRGYEADGMIAQLVDAILRGRVDPWIADEDDGSFGFTKDGCRVVIGFEEGPPVAVSFGAEGFEGQRGIYGKVDGRSGVFFAPLSLRELAGRIYVSRAALRTPADHIAAVRMTQGGKAIADPPRDAIAALYADRVIALGTKGVIADLVIDLTVADGGAPKRIACSSPGEGGERRCTVSGVDATFGVAASRFAALERDAGAR